MTRENEEEGERKKKVKRKRRRKPGFIYLHKNWTVTDIWWEQGIVQLSLNNWLRCVLWKKHALFPFEEAGGKKIDAPTTSPPVNNAKVQIRRMIFHFEKLAVTENKRNRKKHRKKHRVRIRFWSYCGAVVVASYNTRETNSLSGYCTSLAAHRYVSDMLHGSVFRPHPVKSLQAKCQWVYTMFILSWTGTETWEK